MPDVLTSWLSPRAAAVYLSCSVSHLLRSARRHDIVGYRCGRGWRFRRSDLDAYIERSRAPLPEPVVSGPRETGR